MPDLPHPPDAWWQGVPWWGYLAFAGYMGFLAFVAGPYVRSWFRGQTGALQAREGAVLAAQGLLDTGRNSFVAMLQATADKAVADLAAERATWEARRDAVEADRDEGWDLARGMEDVAHRARHEHVALASRFNALLCVSLKMVLGQLPMDRAVAALVETKVAPEPPPIPSLREVERRSPDQAVAPGQPKPG